MRSWSRIYFVALAFLTAVASAESIRFDTHGGDAWTFELPVSGTFDATACKQVQVRTARAAVDATMINDRFFATALLRPGQNEITAECARDTKRTSRATQQWIVPLADRPKARIRLRIADHTIQVDADASELAPATIAPLVRFEWRMRANNPERLQASESLAARALTLQIPSEDGEYYATLKIEDALGRTDESTAVFRVAASKPEIIDLQSEHPRWFDSAVLYGAAPYEFEPQSFRGIENRLDEIAALGATAIWLSPVTAAAPDDFGYAVADQFATRPNFGGEAGLRSLVTKAHSLGLRVLVDFVPNHLSESHRYYLDAERAGTQSPTTIGSIAMRAARLHSTSTGRI